MSAPFSLAGLLRLRKVQEDQAAGEYAVATARIRRTSTRVRHVRDELAAATSAPVSAATLHALAAARAAAQSQLADLSHVLAADELSAVRALDGLNSARRAVSALEKLEHRHRVESVTEELRREQIGLDERTVQEWHRRGGSRP